MVCKTTLAIFCAFTLAGCDAATGPTVPYEVNEVAQPASLNLTFLTDEFFRSATAANCANRYPANMAMRGACARNAVEGRASFMDARKNFADNPDMMAALDNCFARYHEGDSANFMMIGACTRNNIEGLDSLNEITAVK